MSKIKLDTVVLPLLPVIPIIFEFVKPKANSISEIKGIFYLIRFITTGLESLIPGLLTTRLKFKDNAL